MKIYESIFHMLFENEYEYEYEYIILYIIKKMYAVVEYTDCRKEQFFKVIITTDDVEYAKKVVFQNAKKYLPKSTADDVYKITTEFENEYLRPINKTIIEYKIVRLEQYNNGFRKHYSDSTVYAVIEFTNKEIEEIEEIEEIDTSLICNY